MATISKTSTFEVPKFLSEFSPLRSVGFCLWLGLGLPLPRRNTAALGSPQRQRFRGRAAPGGEGGRGCRDQRQLWPRGRILGRKPHEALGFRCEEVNEDVDGSLMVPLGMPWDSVVKCIVFVERISQKTFCTNMWCFLLLLRFLHPFCYSVETRHVLMTILVWQYFGATIAFQN